MLNRPVLAIDQSALEGLSALLLERAGLKITPEGYHGLRLALASRMPALGISDAGEYVRRLRQLAGEHELRSLLPLVTVGKTEFFRDGKQFSALEGKIIPEILRRAGQEGRRARIWSAGCATGEEPYSLAMVALELGARPSQLEIWATDLNLVAVDFAKAGRYPGKKLAGVSEVRRLRLFRPVEGGFELIPEVRQLVRFDGLNLAAPLFPGVRPASLDLILCRNVIIYFSLPIIQALMDRFLEALRPGGILLLGYSESLFKVYDRFEMFEVGGAFGYRRREEPGQEPKAGAAAKTGVFRTSSSAEPRLRSGPRPADPLKPLATFAPATPPPISPPPAKPKPSPAERLRLVTQLMDQGDFGEAQRAAEALMQDAPDDLGALLTLANLYSLMGANDAARASFASALAREPLCVEARVFGGVAALQAGQLGEAREELRKALFLEPNLALGHYLLAQVNERLAEVEEARRCYRNALSQLRFPQRTLAGHYPDMLDSSEALRRAARYALAALEER